MSKIVESEEYLNTQESIEEMEASKKLFYDNVKPYLRVYHFNGKKTPWYKKKEVVAFKLGKPIRKASIPLSGILNDWTSYLQSLGYHAETTNLKSAITTLPDDAVSMLHLPAGKEFVKRSRFTHADGIPICTWDTYYPVELVEDIKEDIMSGSTINIVEYIKEKHGIVIGVSKDKYTARITTFEEQALFQLLTDEAVLILQRASYTKDKSTLVLYSDMVLVGSWFAPEHEYPVNIWNK